MERGLREHHAAALEALPDRLGAAAPLRARYLELVARHGAPFTDNLTDPHAWTTYVYYAEVVARLLGPGARVVDWGAGYAHVTLLLRARGLDALAYHMYPPAHYEPFRAALGIPSAFGKDPNVLALPDAAADAVLSSGVLEHVREDGVGREDLALRDIARVLRPGGWFVAWNLPTRAAPADLLAKVRGAWHHETRYGAREVRALLRGAGLELVHLERHGGTPLGVALKRLGGAGGGEGDRAAAFAWDRHLAAVPPFAWVAQNFALAARRPLSKPP